MNWYLFAGYAVFWTFIFLYVVFLHRKQKQLNRELQQLSETLKQP